MGIWIGLAFLAGFLFVFGLNLLATDVQRERAQRARAEQMEQARARQTARARIAVQHRDLYEMAAAAGSSVEPRRKPIAQMVELFFEQAGVRIRPWQVAVLGIVLGGVSAVAISVWSGSAVFGILTAGVAGCLPLLAVSYARKRRTDRLLSQLPDAFDLISRMMRAGQTFAQSMQMTANEGSAPLSDEFGYCCDQQRLGLSAEAALRDLSRRTGILEIRIFVLAVLVHRQTGGNLSDLLENLSHVIRERHRVKGIISALTAEGRMQAYILMALPILMLMLLSALNPGYVQELYERPGLLLLTGAGVAFGTFWMRRIVNFDY